MSSSSSTTSVSNATKTLSAKQTATTKKQEALSKEFVKIFADNGLDKMAKEVGIVNSNGKIPVGRSKSAAANTSSLKKRKIAPSMAPPKASQATKSASRKNVSGGKGGTSGSATKKKRVQRTGQSGKANKGLRHFSMKVCQKVQMKGKTTYNEVADELVREYAASVLTNPVDQSYDEKNIRRRVYDALNVLMAMDIISKEKNKEIHWKGLPTNAANDIDKLQEEKEAKEKILERKRQHLQELLLQQIAFKNLVRRNHKESAWHHEETKIPLPFIIVSTNNSTTVQCEMAEDRSDIFFDFNEKFEIHDDNDILKKMGMQQFDFADAHKLVPNQLVKFLPGYSESQSSKVKAEVKRTSKNPQHSSSETRL